MIYDSYIGSHWPGEDVAPGVEGCRGVGVEALNMNPVYRGTGLDFLCSSNNINKQAGAELCQAQGKLRLVWLWLDSGLL